MMSWLKKTSISITLASLTGFGSACNSRPTYNIQVHQFDSDCAGKISALVQYDPDPLVHRLDTDPDYEKILADAGVTFQVTGYDWKASFASGIECTFIGGSQTSECRILATNEDAQCSSSLNLICFRYPSQGPGFTAPIAKPGECVVQIAADSSIDESSTAEESKQN